VSNEKIKSLDIERRKKKTPSIKDAIRRAKQHIRNVGAEGAEEPEGFASGDMDKFLEKPDEYEKDENND